MAPAEHTNTHQSPWDIVMSQIGQERWNHYKKDMIPVENKYIENVKWMGSDQAANQSASLAASGFRQQGDAAVRSAENDMLTNGVNPNSGAYKMQVADMGNKMSTGLADANVAARLGQKSEYFKGLQGLVETGNGMSSDAINNISDVAGMARDRAMTNSEMNAKESAALGTGIGAAAGMGLGTYARKYGGL